MDTWGICSAYVSCPFSSLNAFEVFQSNIFFDSLRIPYSVFWTYSPPHFPLPLPLFHPFTLSHPTLRLLFPVVSLAGPVCVAQWVLGVGLALTWSHSTMGHVFTENWFFLSQWPSDVHNSLATGETLFPLPWLCAGAVSDWSLSGAHIGCHSCYAVICESVQPCLRSTIPWYYPPSVPLAIFLSPLPRRFLRLRGGVWLNSRLSMPQSFAHWAVGGLCVSAIYRKEGNLWRGWRDALIYGCFPNY